MGGLWDDQMKNDIIAANGSVQDIARIPEDLKDLYKTVWELSMRDIIDMAADRGVYIDQSQSLNLFVENPNFGKLTSMHFHAWKKGLKTGMYYLRTKAATDAIKFTVEKKTEVQPVVAPVAEVIPAQTNTTVEIHTPTQDIEITVENGLADMINDTRKPKIIYAGDDQEACETCSA